MPINNFQDWQNNIEVKHKLPEDLEQKILRQRDSLSHFVSVVEIFAPNALQIALDMAGGRQSPTQNISGSPTVPPHTQTNWRVPTPPPSGPEQASDFFSRFLFNDKIRTTE